MENTTIESPMPDPKLAASLKNEKYLVPVFIIWVLMPPRTYSQCNSPASKP